MPKLGRTSTSDFAIVRSMRSHALVHSLAQTWNQIGRNPAAALGNIAPNIGSIVAIEKDKERTPGQIFPTFLALNSNGAVGSGYLPADIRALQGHARRRRHRQHHQSRRPGRASTTAVNLLHSLDDSLRIDSPYGAAMEDYDDFYKAAQGLMYNPVVNSAFGFTTAESARYGSTALGNACLVARRC